MTRPATSSTSSPGDIGQYLLGGSGGLPSNMPGGAEDWTDLDTLVDLWLMDLDTLELERLVENGRAPAWSPQAVSDPAQFNHWVFLPLIRRPG